MFAALAAILFFGIETNPVIRRGSRRRLGISDLAYVVLSKCAPNDRQPTKLSHHQLVTGCVQKYFLIYDSMTTKFVRRLLFGIVDIMNLNLARIRRCISVCLRILLVLGEISFSASTAVFCQELSIDNDVSMLDDTEKRLARATRGSDVERFITAAERRLHRIQGKTPRYSDIKQLVFLARLYEITNRPNSAKRLFSRALDTSQRILSRDDWRSRDVSIAYTMFRARQPLTRDDRELVFDAWRKRLALPRTLRSAVNSPIFRGRISSERDSIGRSTIEIRRILGKDDLHVLELVCAEDEMRIIENRSNGVKGCATCGIEELSGILGNNHPHIAELFLRRGDLRVLAGSFDEAREDFKNSFAIQSRTFGKNHRLPIHSLFRIAMTYELQGRLKQAFNTLDKPLLTVDMSSSKTWDTSDIWNRFISICARAGQNKRSDECQNMLIQAVRDDADSMSLEKCRKLASLAYTHYTFESYVTADRYTNEAKKIWEQITDDELNDVLGVTSVAAAWCRAGAPDDAIRLLKEASKKYNESFSKNYVYYLELGNCYAWRHDYQEAVFAYQHAIESLRSNRGDAALEFPIQVRLARAFRRLGRLKDAHLAINVVIGRDKTSENLNALALLASVWQRKADYYCEEGDYVAARQCFVKMLGIGGETAEQSPGRIVELFVESGQRLFELEGCVLAAVDTLRHALLLHRQHAPKPDLKEAEILGRLGLAYQAADHLPQARSHLKHSLQLFEQLGGPDDPQTIGARIQLGNIVREMGDSATAYSHLEQAVQQAAASSLTNQRILAAAYYDLGAIYAASNQPRQAQQCFQRCQSLWDQVLAEQGLQTKALLIRADIALNTGRYEAAKRDLQLAIRRQQLQSKSFHPQMVEGLNLMGVAEAALGNAQQARHNFQKALDIQSESPRQDHILGIKCLDNLGMLALSGGDARQARQYFERAMRARLQRTASLVNSLSEAELLAHSKANSADLARLLSALSSDRRANAQTAYDWVLSEESVVWLALQRRASYARQSQRATRLFDELRLTKNQLAQLTFARPDAGRPFDIQSKPADELIVAAARQARLTLLSRRKEDLEQQLGDLYRRTLPSQAPPSLNTEQLVRQLPAEVGVAHLVHAVDWRAEPRHALTPTPHYQAFLVRRPNGKFRSVEWIDLGLAADIDAQVRRWRESIVAARGRGLELTPRDKGAKTEAAKIENDRPSPAQAFRRQVWEKIEPWTQGLKTLIIIPDGALHRVPWPAIPNTRQGGHLIERFALASVPKAEQIRALMTQNNPQGDGLLLVGGVAYDRQHAQTDSDSDSDSDTAPTRRYRAPPRDEQGTARWPFLPGSQAEARAIRELAEGRAQVALLEGLSANEAALREQMPRHRYIHLATHGFFANPRFRSAFGHDVESERLAPGGFVMTGQFGTVTGRNPLLLSGLVLAGANLPSGANADQRQSPDDGIMTAEELIDLNLSETELAVLSGCETGLGETAGGEGVYGLQRAFALAGARSTIASLWQVNDEATRALMIEFYSNMWRKGMPKLAALREAQLAMLQGRIKLQGPASLTSSPRPTHLWAGWMINGDWR